MSTGRPAQQQVDVAHGLVRAASALKPALADPNTATSRAEARLQGGSPDPTNLTAMWGQAFSLQPGFCPAPQ
jgi:hypothetical protein